MPPGQLTILLVTASVILRGYNFNSNGEVQIRLKYLGLRQIYPNLAKKCRFGVLLCALFHCLCQPPTIVSTMLRNSAIISLFYNYSTASFHVPFKYKDAATPFQGVEIRERVREGRLVVGMLSGV